MKSIEKTILDNEKLEHEDLKASYEFFFALGCLGIISSHLNFEAYSLPDFLCVSLSLIYLIYALLGYSFLMFKMNWFRKIIGGFAFILGIFFTFSLTITLYQLFKILY